jgi:RHS repeat-associated protein
VSDKKIAVASTTNPNLIAYYTADVVTANDYYPFGMTMPGRKYTAPNSNYRYGFNGQEKSNEVTEGNYTAEYWEYDSRIGRRWNIDPVSKEYESPYTCLGNNPIWFMDPNGLDTLKSREGAKNGDVYKYKDTWLTKSKAGWFDGNGAAYCFSKKKRLSDLKVENGVIKNPNVKVNILSQLERPQRPVTTYLIFHRTGGSNADGSITWWSRSGNSDRIGAHFIIDKNGQITQTGNLDLRVNHAAPYNYKSIGIEFVGREIGENKGNWEPVTDKQIASGVWLIQQLMMLYKVPKTNLLNHEDVADKHKREGRQVAESVIPLLNDKK